MTSLQLPLAPIRFLPLIVLLTAFLLMPQVYLYPHFSVSPLPPPLLLILLSLNISVQVAFPNGTVSMVEVPWMIYTMYNLSYANGHCATLNMTEEVSTRDEDIFPERGPQPPCPLWQFLECVCFYRP